MPHERWFGVCEDVLGAAGGRPHWGKMHRLDATATCASATRASTTSSRCATSWTRPGVFANPYLERVLGP